MAKECFYPELRPSDNDLLKKICETMQPSYRAKAIALFKCEAKKLRGKWDGYNLLDYISHVIKQVAGEGKDKKKKLLKFEISLENALQDRKDETTVTLSLFKLRKMVGDGGLQTENARASFESLAEAQKISEVQCLHDYLNFCLGNGYLVRNFRNTTTTKGEAPIINSADLKETVDDLHYFLDHWQEIEANKKNSQSLNIDERYLGERNFSYDVSLGTGSDRLTIDDKVNELTVSKVAHLLRWEYRLTELHGRENELAELKEWIDQPADKVSVSIKLIHGEGGVGKTRLAYDFARKCRRRGWNAGAMGKNRKSYFDGDWWYGNKGVLLIIDYPEEQKQKTEALIHALHDGFNPPEGKAVRVLLLSRSKSVFDDVAGAMRGRVNMNSMLLKGFDQVDLAWGVFTDAWDSIIENQPESRKSSLNGERYPVREPEFITWLERGDENRKRNSHGTPLIIIALAVYLSNEEDRNDRIFLDIDTAGLVRELTKHEAKRIQEEVSDSSRNIDYQGVLLVKAVAAIADGFNASDYKTFKAHVKTECVEVGLPTVNDLKALSLWGHRGSGEDEDGGLSGLKPDIFAADFLDYCLKLYAENEEAKWVFAALGVYLVDTAAVDDQAIISNFFRLRRLIYDTKFRLKARQCWSVEALSSALIVNPNISLWVSDNLATYDLGRDLDSFSATAALQAFNITAETSDKNHVNYRFNIASDLNNLSICLARLGATDNSIAANRRAVQIYEELAEEDMPAYCDDLTRSLSNLENCLSQAGKFSESLQAAERKVEIFEGLAAENFATYQTKLASSLNDFSTRFGRADKHNEGLRAAQRAVEIYEKLEKKSFSTYGLDLSKSLSTASNRLAELGRLDESLIYIERAVKIRNKIAEENTSAANKADLANGLVNLAVRQAELDKKEESLETNQLAIQLYETLVQDNYMAYRPDLVISLNNSTIGLDETGKADMALIVAERVVAICEELAEENFLRYADSLAGNLKALYIRYSSLDMADKELKTMERAIDVCGELSTIDFAIYGAEYGKNLFNMSVRLAAANNRDRALHSLQESIDTFSKLSKTVDVVYRVNLGGALLMYCLIYRFDLKKLIQAKEIYIEVWDTSDEHWVSHFPEYLDFILDSAENDQQVEAIEIIKGIKQEIRLI